MVDDLGTVRELANGQDDEPGPIVIWHDLTHPVGVLQRLAAIDLP